MGSPRLCSQPAVPPISQYPPEQSSPCCCCVAPDRQQWIETPAPEVLPGLPTAPHSSARVRRDFVSGDPSSTVSVQSKLQILCRFVSVGQCQCLCPLLASSRGIA